MEVTCLSVTVDRERVVSDVTDTVMLPGASCL